MDTGQYGNNGNNALVHVMLDKGQGRVHAIIPNQNMVVTIAMYLDQPMQNTSFVIARLVPVRYVGTIVLVYSLFLLLILTNISLLLRYTKFLLISRVVTNAVQSTSPRYGPLIKKTMPVLQGAKYHVSIDIINTNYERSSEYAEIKIDAVNYGECTPSIAGSCRRT